MKKIIPVLYLLVLTVLLAACGPMTLAPTATAPVQAVFATLERPTKLPEPSATLAAQEPIPGSFPPAAQAARAALSKQLGVPAEKIEVRNVEPVDWPDGCLGLAGPDEVCTQAIVPGFRVTLVSGTTEYKYRANASGSVLRLEKGPALANTGEAAQPFATWTGPDCNEANVLKDGLSFGKCGGQMAVVLWPGGKIPDAMQEFLNRYAAFQAETPAGKLAFNGSGKNVATQAEQRALAEWVKLQFLMAQAGKTDATWELAFSYSRLGGIAGFCDYVSVYLDGSVNVSSCKGVNASLRLSATQLETMYAWHDGLKPVDYAYSDPAAADAMTIKLTMAGQGQKTADDATTRAMVEFAAGLAAQAGFKAQASADVSAAQEVLFNYLAALHNGDFLLASQLYGGDTSLLQTWNPDVKANLPKWLELGCTQNGLVCLLPRSITYRGPDVRGGYQFYVEFNNPDGTLFRQAYDTGQGSISTFQFAVIKNGATWQAMDLPPYVP